MLTNQRVEDIDQLLNELEREAQSELPTAQFLSHFMQRLRFLLECDSVAYLAPTESAWLTIAQCGNFSEKLSESYAQAFRREVMAGKSLDAVAGVCESLNWYATPLRPGNFAKGCLLVSLRTAPPAASVPGMLELLAAFAEVLALRQMADLEKFLDVRWDRLQQLSATLLDSSFTGDSASLLVNQLVPLFNAARVSLGSINLLGSTRLLRISGTPNLDPNSKTVRTLTQLAQAAFQKRQPVLRQHRIAAANEGMDPIGDDGAFHNSISLPIVARATSKKIEHVLVIEWQSYEEMLAATSNVVHMLPTLSLAWTQHCRWQRIPRPLRVLGERRWSPEKWKSRLIVTAVLALLAFAAYSALTKPYPLTIEATGVIEPQTFRTIFTTLDGYVSELLVEDGQLVEVNQPLARLQTPELDLRIETLIGELRAAAEKRNALQVASSQLDLSAADSLITQNRIAAEIKQIDTQEANLNAQLKLLRKEASKSLIVAPIRGTVVAKDMRQQLASRPLRRGDALFRIVDLEGPWHLRIQVADRDSGYVLSSTHSLDARQSMGFNNAQHNSKDESHTPDNADGKATAQQPIKFVLDSLPGEQFDARVNWVANLVQNRTGDGCFVEMHASVDRSVVDRTYMGASARAYFRCGDQPTWFVWCRPLVEAVQRRLWFWS